MPYKSIFTNTSSSALLTDLYQLTMAYGYWKCGIGEKEAVFNMFFRKEPFSGGYAIAAGLETLVDFLEKFRFDSSDLDYLSSLKGHDGTPLFESGFLKYLEDLKFTCSVEAIPEGSLVFKNEPLIQVHGPLLQAQLIESPLLNIINFQTLIATKASRICQAARSAPVLEFGLRRAQGIDGSLSASRASHIGGCANTSNVLAGKVFGIPVSGTHAHSWVMSFDSEPEAFSRYANVMENNCILLVDTYNTRTGIINAIQIGRILKERGKKLLAVRIDSGDLAYLSQMARQMLDDAGLPEVKIVVTNDLDEHILESLHEQHAKIDLAGVGTKMVTAYDQPALGGVYKLSALKNKEGVWENKIKLSEQTIKINIPGKLQVKRYSKNGEIVADMIYDTTLGIKENPWIIDPNDPAKRKSMQENECDSTDLLVPVMVKGKTVYSKPKLSEIRNKAFKELQTLHVGVKRFVNPHVYVTGVEEQLYEQRLRLILEQRKLIS